MQVRLLDGLGGVAPSAWDAIAGDDDPFVEHAFLSTLEDSGSVGEGSGWQPCHVTVWEGERLVGALPLYLKEHSFGEFIFDWAWADGAMRLGIDYYPKLVSMVPFTPATGRRVLVADDVDRSRVIASILDGCFEAAERHRVSSLHLLFLGTQEQREVTVQSNAWMARLTSQYHWYNNNYGSFDDFLARFRAQLRKQVRKERRRVAESGLDVRVLESHELGEHEWDALKRFYRITCARHGSYPYLTPRFFELARERLSHRAVAGMAYHDGRAVAASLNFEKGPHLYGRYWGCTEEHDFLHFELCYYRLIERAIARGMQRFEAGAQGTHKLRRGLMPSPIHSAHWIRHPVLARAVADFLPREASAVEHQMTELARHGPFKREEGSS